MRLRTAAVATSTSAATARPLPPTLGTNCWVTTPCSADANCTRICCCWWAGNTSITRSTDCGASCVCSVAKTRWPVSAAVSAAEPGHRVGGVELEVVLELLPLLLGEDPVHHAADLRAVELGELGERLDVAVDPHARMDAGGEVEVGAAQLDHPLQQLVDVHFAF